jgi:hypothetical protein
MLRDFVIKSRVVELSLRVSTVETNRDLDFSFCKDQLLKPVEIILNVKTRLFFASVEIFLLRLGLVEILIEIVETGQYCLY